MTFTLEYLCNTDCQLTDEQVDALGNQILALLDSGHEKAAIRFLRTLILPRPYHFGVPAESELTGYKDRSEYYRPILTMWRSPNGLRGGVLTDRILAIVMDNRDRIKSLTSQDPVDFEAVFAVTADTGMECKMPDTIGRLRQAAEKLPTKAARDIMMLRIDKFEKGENTL